MDFSKILVTGAKGRLGQALIIRGCTPYEGDVTSRRDAYRELMSKNPEIIINCAAITDVDECEKDIIRSFTINGFANESFIPHFKGKWVQISTDFVFDGKKGPYKEYDSTYPINTYGSSKMVGEFGAQMFPKWLIIRTTNLYSHFNKPDFVSWVRERLQNRLPVKVSPEQFGNPTYVSHLADGVLTAIEKEITGILNIVGTDLLSRYEFAQMIARTFDFDVKFIQKDYNYNPFARRPLKAGLLTDLAENYQIPLWGAWEGLQDLKRRTNLK